MSTSPWRRDALRTDPRDPARPTSRSTTPRTPLLRPTPLVAVVAIAPPRLRELMVLGLRSFSIRQQCASSRIGLFEQLVGKPDLLVLSDPFDGADAVTLLAIIRTAGYRNPVVVIGHASRALRARANLLGPLTLVPDPARADAARGEPWLRRCVTAAATAVR